MNLKHFFNLPPLNFSRRPLLGLVTALLLALLTVGCDSSGGDSFVATPGGDNGQVGGTGSVTFNFVQAQTPITVPTGTTSLRFEFFSELGGTGSLLLREDRAYLPQITIDGVPTSVRSVVVTAYDGDDFPISEFTANLTVTADSTTFVDGADGNAEAVTLTGISVNPATLSLGLAGSVTLDVLANFSNGDSVPLSGTTLSEVLFESDDSSTASVSPDGTVSAVLAGSTFITVTFRGFTTTVPVTVSTGNNIPPLAENLTVDPTAVTLPRGTLSEPLVFTVTFATGETVEVGADQGVDYTSTNSGITVTEDDQIAIGPNVAPGTYTVTGSFAGLQANVTVTVSPATLDSISVSPAVISLPYGGFEQLLVVTGFFSDQTSEQVNPALLTFNPTLTDNFEIDADGLLVTDLDGTPGTDTVTITHDQGPSTTASVTVGQVVVNSLTVSPPSITLDAGEFVDVVVTANLSNGQNVNVTEFASLQAESSNSNSVVVNGNRVVAVDPGSTATITYTIENAGAGGADAIGTLTVTVTEVTLESATIFYAGNEIGASQETVNLPRGYVGVFEVQGQFSNGTERRLRPDEYTLTKNGGALNPAAIQLLNPGYELRTPDDIYTNGLPRNASTNLQDAAAEETANEIVDDFLGRVRTPSTSTDSSNISEIAVDASFKAVVADWYRGEYDTTYTGLNPNFVAPGSSANIEIGIVGYPEFDRNVSVTVTDPTLSPTVASIAFANYPGDPNIVVGTPREIEIRVNFPAAVPPESLPPFVAAQTNFKLAEANVSFATDDLPNPNPTGPTYRQVLHHRATEIGFVGITSDVPYNVGLLLIAAEPIGGRVAAPRVVNNPIFTPPADNPANYTPTTYRDDLLVFGPATGFAVRELPEFVPGRDPGPTQIAGNTVSPDARAPVDQIVVTYSTFNNGGAGFRVVNPVMFSLVPPTALTLEVGASQIFRTLVQFTATQTTADDRSADYPPTLPLGETNVVGVPSTSSGQLTVSGVLPGQATVTALDVQGNPIPAVGSVNIGTAADPDIVPADDQCVITVVPAP